MEHILLMVAVLGFDLLGRNMDVTVDVMVKVLNSRNFTNWDCKTTPIQ